ncbi:MAG: TetR/AcrR family transcriptional regulator [Aquisalinus sp.]|nr:TetR/AcrR family transcriptional regulator [Aquisalinus sp.]
MEKVSAPQQDLTAETQRLFGSKTRGKILQASLIRFNESGFDRVSTAQLAEAAQVLDGTLWYHFKAKQDLVVAHLDALEARLETHLAAEIIDNPNGMAKHFFGMFDILWEFRYLLRDPLQALQEDEMLARLQLTYRSIESRAEERLLRVERLGLIDLSDTDVKALVTSCFIVGRHWLDYVRIREAGQIDLDHSRRQGMIQLLTLIRPYFTEKARALFAGLDLVTLIREQNG